MRRWYVCPMLLEDILDDEQQVTGRQVWVSKIYTLGYHNQTIVVGTPDVKAWCLTFVRDDTNDWEALNTPDIAFIGELPQGESPEWFHTQTMNSLAIPTGDKNKFKNALSGVGIDHSALDDDSPMLDWLNIVKDDLGGNPIEGMSV